MTLADQLGLHFHYRDALIIGTVIALVACVWITPKAIRKLRGAGIVGRDRHKIGRPEIPEMGGLALFVAFNMGAFAVLALSHLAGNPLVLVLASLVVIAGATLTGALDDLIVLRQRFKAALPFAFAVPLALFIQDTTIWFPIVGTVDFGILYPLILVPAGVACASNGFNMLEGFNGLGTGLGIITGLALGFLVLLVGDVSALALLAPLLGALAGFWIFNAYPAKVFPGDTMTLMVGAALAIVAIVGKVEFWGAILFVPQIVEFMIKGKNHFPTSQWGGQLHEDGQMSTERDPPVGIAQAVMKAAGRISEQGLVFTILGLQAVLSIAVIAAAVWLQ